MAQKIVISKSGYNALTESDQNNYIFHSDYNTFKIISESTLTSQSITGDPTTVSLAHGLDYIPAVMAFAKFPDGYVTLPRGTERAGTPPNDRDWIVEVDDTYVYFMFYKNGSANYSVDLKCYIFEAPAN